MVASVGLASPYGALRDITSGLPSIGNMEGKATLPCSSRCVTPMARSSPLSRKMLRFPFDEAFHRPVGLTVTDTKKKIFEHLKPAFAVNNFRMELQTEQSP